jgi:hypothetical protein
MICRKCGKVTPRNSNSQLYCKKCAAIVVKDNKRRARGKKRRLNPSKLEMHTMDSAEMIAMCLSCKIESCAGDCIAIQRLRMEAKAHA